MDLVDKLKEYGVLTDEEMKELLLTENGALRNKLFLTAQEVLRTLFHNQVWFQGTLQFTNHCPENCLFCERRAENRELERFRLNWEQIKGACRQGYELGIRSFVLSGGQDPYYTDMILCNILTNLKKEFPDCAIGLSMGERNHLSYQRLMRSGAERYTLSFVTADPLHFSKLHAPRRVLSTKITCLNDLKELGYEVDTGFLVGAPGEEAEHLLRDLTLLSELHPQSLTLTPFCPQTGTPFRQGNKAPLEEYLRLIAVLRILYPRANIAVPWEIRRIHTRGQLLSIQSGANVIRMLMEPPAAAGDLQNQSRKNLLHTIEVQYRFLKSYGYALTPGRGDSLLNSKMIRKKFN